MIRLVLALTVFAVLFLQTTDAFWRGGSGRSKNRNCMWHAFQKGLCNRRPDGSLYRRDTRLKIPKRGNGRDCVGDAYRDVPCEMITYIAHTFMKISREPSIDGAAGFARGLNKNKFEDRNPCASAIKDHSGTRLSGKKCEAHKTTTRHKRQAEGGDGDGGGGDGGDGGIKTLKMRDVLFMIDESGSIGHKNFLKQMAFVQAVTNSLCGTISIGAKTTRVGVMTFDFKRHIKLDFDKFFQKAQVLDLMKTIKFDKFDTHSTCMVDALNFTKTDMFIPARGSRVLDTDTERLLIMITDGCANCAGENDAQLRQMLREQAKSLSEAQISILSVYVGTSETCVEHMEALADGSHCFQVFKLLNWSELDEMTKTINEEMCMDAWYLGQSCG